MSTPILFSAQQGWDTSNLPAPYNVIDKRSKSANSIHSFNTNGNFATLHADAVRAILAYAGDPSITTEYALIEVADTKWAAEWKRSDGSIDIAAISTNGDIQAANVTTTGAFMPFKTLGSKTDRVPIEAIALALLPYLSKVSSESKNDLTEVCQAVANANIDAESCINSVFRLCDALYFGVQGNNPPIKVNIPADGNITMIPKMSIKTGSLNGTILTGNAKILNGATNGKIQSKKKKVTMADAKVEFASYRNSRHWSAEEEDLIPTFPDDYVMQPEVLKIARMYIGTKKNTRPMVQFLWRGITSYGKSTGVEALACLLHTPLLRMTCYPTMETQNFKSDFVPDTSSHVASKLPSFDEIACDPETAYYKLTGIQDESATCDMCLEEYGKVRASENSSAPKFRHVVSNYIKALQNGYICEIQEGSRIKDSGVLVGLNEFDRPGAIIPLVDGSYCRRHEDALVIYTDNVGYVSCRPIDPSVIRRMAFVIDSNTMTKQQVMDRVIYNTGFADKDILEKMYQVWETVQKFCASHEINEGSVSVTELEMWASCVMAEGYTNLLENCTNCIVSKATSDTDEQDEISSAIAVLM